MQDFGGIKSKAVRSHVNLRHALHMIAHFNVFKICLCHQFALIVLLYKCMTFFYHHCKFYFLLELKTDDCLTGITLHLTASVQLLHSRIIYTVINLVSHSNNIKII